jgi:superfamily II DNA or RNA helicase
MRLRNAYYRVGMSGTPLARGDRRSLLTIAATGPVIYRIKSEVLIQAGVLSRPKIRLTPVAQTSERPTWQGVYGECIVRSAKRNAAIAAQARRAQKPCLVFVKEIAHGRELEKRLRAAGLTTEFVWGTDSVDERKSAVRRLVHGDTDALVASVIFNEGIDIPELRSVVIASGGKSVIAALQRIGRGMRVQKDAQGKVIKDTFEVFDVADKGCKWLERHTRARLRAYASEGYETIVEAALT